MHQRERVVRPAASQAHFRHCGVSGLTTRGPFARRAIFHVLCAAQKMDSLSPSREEWRAEWICTGRCVKGDGGVAVSPSGRVAIDGNDGRKK